jgi:hypothetical protein
MSEPLSGSWITSREIYDAVVRLTGRIDVIIEQQNHMARDIEDVKKDLRDTAKDHEERLRTLERARWPLPALAAVIALVSLGLTIVSALN